jgi:hypothetical protein
VALDAAVAISIAVSTVVVRRFGTRPAEQVTATAG